jgi:hypothetical protein
MSKAATVFTCAAVSVCALIAPDALYAQSAQSAPNVLPNGSFEINTTGSDAPDGWTRQMWVAGSQLTRDPDVAHDGVWSARIAAPTANDAAWTQTITGLTPNANYLLSGWIRTEDVAPWDPTVLGGANLSLWGTWLSTQPLLGTNDWTYVSMVFNAGATGSVTVAARIGYWGATASGTAWFDDLRVREILATDPHPSWDVLVLIYDRTDFSYTDQFGTHHLVGQIPPEQVATAAANATRFVNTDIPALTSGNMIPTLTVRYPGTLRTLTAFGNAWWPSTADTAADRDVAFDSVIVIWQPTVVDQGTGELRWIGNAAGLTPPMGTGQTYAAIIIEAATLYGHLNVFKHEWGHSILFYYDAAGTAPRPTVQNHTTAGTYVDCLTGQDYIWLDETDANPIPNSIYSNAAGFTHGYYSGTTALASDPLRTCLGITPLAWATGGPVSKPGAPDVPSPGTTIHDIRQLLSDLVAAGTLPRSSSRSLEAALDQAGRALSRDRAPAAIKALTKFMEQVNALKRKGRLGATNASALRERAQRVIEDLK